MSIDQLDKIDIISTSASGVIVLHIADHLEWDEEQEHILLLQDKINAYLQFIDDGQVFEDYPSAVNSKITIEIIFKFEPSHSSLSYLNRFKKIVDELGYSLSWRTH